MNKNSLLKRSLLMGAVMMMAACGKDEPDPTSIDGPAFSDPTEIASSVQISKIISEGEDIKIDGVDITNGGDFVFTYDSENRLAIATESNIYTDEYGTFDWTDVHELSYDNDKLTKIVSTFTNTRSIDGDAYTQETISTKTFTYDVAGRLYTLNIVSATKNSIGEIQEYHRSLSKYEYDAQNHLVKLSVSDDHFDMGGGEEYWIEYTWNNDNVVKEQLYFVSNDPGERKKPLVSEQNLRRSRLSRLSKADGELEEDIIYSNYDDKANPLKILSVLYGAPFGQLISKNNPGKFVEFYIDGNGTVQQDYEMNITYAYDAQGRPITITMVESQEGEIDRSETFSIEYRN